MFEGWAEFFLLLGGASAALIGLVFIVTTLASDMRVGTETLSRGASLYMTPTVFHYTSVLVLCALGCVPHADGWPVAAVLGGWALCGLGYSTVMAVLVRLQRLPDSGGWADVWSYGILPAALYIGLFGAAWLSWRESPNAPYALAIGLVALLIVGIRNAWDLISFIAPRSAAGPDEK